MCDSQEKYYNSSSLLNEAREEWSNMHGLIFVLSQGKSTRTPIANLLPIHQFKSRKQQCFIEHDNKSE